MAKHIARERPLAVLLQEVIPPALEPPASKHAVQKGDGAKVAECSAEGCFVDISGRPVFWVHGGQFGLSFTMDGHLEEISSFDLWVFTRETCVSGNFGIVEFLSLGP